MGKYDPNVESQSGLGSYLVETVAIREQLPILVRELGVRTFLDAPCGDFNWMKETNLGVEKYIGLELSWENVQNNNARYAQPGREFVAGDVVWSDLPAVDMILCRDCLVHLPFRGALMAIKNFKRSGSKYLVTTTYPTIAENSDCPFWGWRKLNLELPPFSLGKSMRLLEERGPRCEPGQDDHGKALGVWSIKDLYSYATV